MTLWLAFLIGFGVGAPAGFICGVAAAPHLPRTVLRKVSSMRHSMWEWVKSHTVGVAVLGFLLAVGLGISGFVAYQHSASRQDSAFSQLRADEACQAKVNRVLIETLNARSTASRAAILAPSGFFHALLPAFHVSEQLTPRQQKAFLKALGNASQAANTAYDNYKAALLANPIPDSPKAVCEAQ